jgi:hypothetical protein
MRQRLKLGSPEKHGYAGTRTYVSYFEMLKRCYDPSVIRYPQYGGRGIGVCARWRSSFLSFLEDMGERPTDKTLDRIDNNADYGPENCRWATREQQLRNTRRSVYIQDEQGHRKTLTEWARETGVPRNTLSRYVRIAGLTLEQAIRRFRGRT